MKFGDGLGIIAMLVWLSIAVGPWWVGLAIFGGVAVANIIQATKARHKFTQKDVIALRALEEK